jgi:molecular chaperone DnaJ
MSRDLYVVLGVPPTESSTGIRQAFRDLALRYHPDRAGAQATPYFRDIVEAYRVLSDPGRRESYDRTVEPARVAPPRSRPEPLARLSLFDDFAVTRPLAEDVFDQLFRGFLSPVVRKSDSDDRLDLELVVSAEEAARGGVIALGLPVFYPCRSCHGDGSNVGFTCAACDGRGMMPVEEDIDIPIPRGVRDGTVLRIPLRALGVHGLELDILVRVASP